MRRRLEEQPAWAPTHGSAWIRPVGTDAPGIYRLYVNGEEHPIPDDFCALGGLLAWTTLDDHPHATTGPPQLPLCGAGGRRYPAGIRQNALQVHRLPYRYLRLHAGGGCDGVRNLPNRNLKG